MGAERLDVVVEGPVMTVTLDRPEILNAIDHQTLVELLEAVAALEGRDDLRVMIITGRGRAFSAGGDIKEMETDTEDSFRLTTAFYQRLAAAITSSPKMVIAAVNGYALGGGLELALLCDMRVAGRSARLGLPDLHLGYSPTSGLTYLLTRTVGFGTALHLALDANPIDAETALRIGLVGEVVDDDRLMERAKELATQIAAYPATGVRLTKGGFYRAAESTLAATLGAELEADIECFISPETQSAIAEFVAARQAGQG